MKFTVSVVCFNKLEFTRKCIDSVLKHSRDYRLVVTDNASTDGTAEYLAGLVAQFDNVEVVSKRENTGFIIPNQEVLARVDTPYLVLLNNDAEVPENWLEMLEEPFNVYPRAALSGPEGGCCSLSPSFNGSTGPFEYLEGSCLCVKVSVVRRYGLFSPYLTFAYGEDSDLSLRMRQLGYTLHKVPFTLKHAVGATSKAVSSLVSASRRQNHVVLRQKWGAYLRRRNFDEGFLVRRRGARGDVLLTTPVISALRRLHPGKPIHVETGVPDIFHGNPLVRSVNKLPAGRAYRIVDLDMAYEHRPGMHYVDAYAEEAGVGLEGRRLSFYTSGVGRMQAEVALRGRPAAKRCAMHVGTTGWPGRDWPPERFEAVRRALVAKGYDVVFVGNVAAGVETGGSVWPRATIHMSAAVLETCSLFVGIDSFPLHLAQAVGTPAIGIFGITRPEFVMTDSSVHAACTPPEGTPGYGVRHEMPAATFIPGYADVPRAVSVESVLATIETMEKSNVLRGVSKTP